MVAKKAPAKRPAGWQAATLARLRALIREADPDAVEEVKWRKPSNAMQGVPVWSHDGIICTGEMYKDKVKLTFARGAALEDPAGLFNASLDGGTRRAIDIHEGRLVDAAAFKALVRAAVGENLRAKRPSPAPSRTAKAKAATTKPKPTRKPATKPVLLSGGNPQIAKGDGDAPVQAYLAAMPGWKRDVGKRIDALVTRTAPGVRKAVKWNSPFYGLDQGWFLSFHAFTNYVKVTFFQGSSLRPLPPGESKHKDVRYLDVREGELDETQLASWVKQAAALPGWTP